MRHIQYLALYSLFFVALGCASSQQATTVVSEPPEPAAVSDQPPAAEEPAEPADLLPGQAPDNWMHLDAADSNIPGISSEKGYELAVADRAPRQKVIVAVLDSGIDIEHEDLQAVIWTNTDEEAGNGVDDDGNGYVDDMHGWNFIGGADGENVDNDTFEVTREYARLKTHFEQADTTSLSGEARREFEYYQEIRAAYDAEVAEMYEMNASINSALQVLDAANSIMSDELGTSDFTMDQVRSLSTENEMLQQAQAILVYFDQIGIDRDQIVEEQEKIDGYLEKGLNLEFDPRPIVGDDYGDVTETEYGNRDVIGPDPFHGTHVAGIIGAQRGNGKGMDGVAGNVEIMVLRVVPDGDERDKDVANGIRYAVDNGAKIINMSFGKNFSPYKAAVDEAVRYAIENDVLLVHAAGNDGENNDATSHFPLPPESNGNVEDESWIEVGASSWEGAPNLAASFSNYGRQSVDVFAPGVSIYSTVPGSKYDRADGTSMAAPVVSGLAALIMAYYPEFTAAEVKDIIVESAVSWSDELVLKPGTEDERVPFGELSRTGAIVNMYEALKLAAERAQ